MSIYTLRESAGLYYVFYGPLYTHAKLNKRSITFNIKFLINHIDFVDKADSLEMYTIIAEFNNWDDLVTNYPEIFL
jgi:hypothetical protein